MKAIKNYISNSIKEFNNVTWPTQNQAVRLSIVVLVFILVSAFLLGGVDYLLSTGYQYLLNN